MDKEKYGLMSAGKVESSCWDASSMRGFDRSSMRAGVANQGDLKDRQQQGIAKTAAAAQAEAYSWLRDDPVDPIAGFGFQTSAVDSAGSRDCGESEGAAEMIDMLERRSSLSPLLASEGAVAQEPMSSIPASLLAQLRAIKIKEHVIREAIERHGGGQNGLKSVLRAIMFWLVEKHRHAARTGGLYTSSSEPCSPTFAEAIDRHRWSSYKEAPAGSSSSFQYGGFGDLSSDMPSDLTCMLEATSSLDDSGDPCDLRRSSSGSGEYSKSVSPGNSLQVILGESEGGGLLGGLGACASGPSQNNLSPLSGVWTSAMGPCVFPHEATTRADMIRKRYPSPNLQDIAAADDRNVYQGNKIRRQSPEAAGFSFPQAELPVYGAPTATASEVSGSLGVSGHMEANPFPVGGGHFSFSTFSPPSVDSCPQDFTSFGCQMPLFIEENLGMGVAAQGCGLISRSGSLGYPRRPDNSGHRKKPGDKLVEAPNGSPAASTRLARKNRMDRTRKASQVSRGGIETPLVAVKGREVCPSSGARSAPPQDSPVSQEPTSKVKDRSDKKHLQFLLQKVLRPSDVGNLGRVILPKKDAESHLPWLGAKEKYQFACEDYDTGDKMTLRYRFWPNNDSRMYVLENTGDFVRRHKLQESDRLLIYKDTQHGTYVTRAQKAGDCVEDLPSKLESKEKEDEGKGSRNANSPSVSSSSGTASSDKVVQSPDSIVCSGLECSEDGPATGLLSDNSMAEDDLLDFTHLPGVPTVGGSEVLVRFPSLESFDVESLEVGPVAAGKGSARSSGTP